MNFLEDAFVQKYKEGNTVCGDFYVAERHSRGSIFVVCDGIGSGVYANIAAITCAERIMELFRLGMSVRDISETVAASMHRARTEDIPFSAFVAAIVFPDGRFLAYNYENPAPILIRAGRAAALEPMVYGAGLELIGEMSGSLEEGDVLLLFSDGVSQAGLGYGYDMGVGTAFVADFITAELSKGVLARDVPERILEMCESVSGGAFRDDTSLVSLSSRRARELTLLTGPPSRRALDKAYAEEFMEMPGKKILCGSTTIEIVARELHKEVESLIGNSMGEPPEYLVDDVDLATEGAVTLNQAYNILDEPVENLSKQSMVERFCLLLHEADVIHLMIGKANNLAHTDLIFKQVGVRIRMTAIRLIADKLRAMGKLVIARYY
ncbi:MAG: serine/threonine-protein phosphatase [Deltaproteobacteria bacterium]|nr:serine/threonine-protein phosphatase [Deltaproteobacteria bacterium]